MRGGRFSGRLDEKFNPFEDDRLAEVVRATASAWGRMRKPRYNELEDQITFRLVGRIKNDQEFRLLPYDVDAQYWLLGMEGERLGRLDIHFKHRFSRRDYFAFEAKRLHVRYPRGKRSTEYPTYVGGAGMMAFIVGQYSEDLPASGMLAYVMDGLTDKAWSGLVKRIEARRKALRISPSGGLAPSPISGAITGKQGVYLGETGHAFSKGPFRMLHLILPV
jgi:hypothetical protein